MTTNMNLVVLQENIWTKFHGLETENQYDSSSEEHELYHFMVFHWIAETSQRSYCQSGLIRLVWGY